MKSVLLFAAVSMTSIPFVLGQSSTTATIQTTAVPITSTAGPSSSTSHTPTTTTVKVGVNHDFQPDTISALPGDVIKFIFYPTNHSVVRAEYKNPCIPYNYVVDDGDTFFSGPEVSTQSSERPEWLLTVNDTNPYFFYCSAPGSCIDSHMVGVINPNENFTLDIQKEALQGVKFQLSPGEPWPAEASVTSTSSGTSSTSATPGATTTASAGSGSGTGSTGLSGGAIAGIAIGGAAILIFAIVLIWFCGRKGGIEKGFRKSTVMNPPHPSMVEAQYDNQPKSPPPPTYRDSPYRSPSPAQWSQAGSPHNSYAGYPSPGLASTFSDVHGQLEPPKALSPAPAELMGNTTHPGSPPPGRYEFPG